MRALAVAAITGVVFTTWGQDADDRLAKEAWKNWRHRLSKDFVSCPDGHKTLKDIPIIYGRVGPFRKRPEDYNEEDKKLKAQHDRGEVVFGLGVIAESSPKFKVKCQTCGHTFNESVIIIDGKIMDLSDWSRGAPDPNQFRLAFTKRLLGVPMLDVVEGSLAYRQAVDADGGKVRWELVEYYSTATPADIAARTRKWMEEQGFDSALLKRSENAAASHTYTFEGETVSLSIADDQFWNPGKIRVSFGERREQPKRSGAQIKKE